MLGWLCIRHCGKHIPLIINLILTTNLWDISYLTNKEATCQWVKAKLFKISQQIHIRTKRFSTLPFKNYVLVYFFHFLKFFKNFFPLFYFFNFTILYWFCHISTWIRHRYTHIFTQICVFPWRYRASLVAQLVKNPPAMWETWVRSLGCEDPLEKGMATHSSILAWRIPWTVKSWARLSNFHFHFSCVFNFDIYHNIPRRGREIL